jgi:hypothetical protein
VFFAVIFGGMILALLRGTHRTEIFHNRGRSSLQGIDDHPRVPIQVPYWAQLREALVARFGHGDCDTVQVFSEN